MTILILFLHFALSRPLYRLDPTDPSVDSAVPRQSMSVDLPPRGRITPLQAAWPQRRACDGSSRSSPDGRLRPRLIPSEPSVLRSIELRVSEGREQASRASFSWPCGVYSDAQRGAATNVDDARSGVTLRAAVTECRSSSHIEPHQRPGAWKSAPSCAGASRFKGSENAAVVCGRGSSTRKK